MLVMSRKAGQQIIVGGQVTITIVKVQGNRVSVGIDAPKEIAIQRSEIAFDCPEDEAQLAPVATPREALARAR